MCLLSIIIPNYNNAKLLNRCLDSILHAKTQAIEVIVIDDGSTDDSIKCLQNYEDERLKYYRQENQGVSAARNKGLSYVSGIYVTFCDADDFYLENAIDDLVSIMEREKEDLDILAFNVFQEQLEKEGRRVCRKWPNALSEKICVTDSQRIDCGAYMRFVVQNSNMNSVFNKIYKYSLLSLNKIHFPVGLGIGEDGIFNLKCAAHCNKIKYVPCEFYVYCYGESEFTSGKLRCKTGRIDETLKGFSERKKIIEEFIIAQGISGGRKRKLWQFHEDYMIEQLYHQIKGVKNNVEPAEFGEYIKNNSELRNTSSKLLFRGTSLKRKIQSLAVFATM